MKQIFHHPPEKATGRKYWRSLDELADTPEFRTRLESEFPSGAAELTLDAVSRRSFLQLMGASTALAGLGLAACHRPEKHLVPFTQSNEWAIPGKPLFFATSMPRRSGYLPLVVTTHDGRPTKIEGNPLHPVNRGATDVFAQASILDLYDPDRSRFFLENTVKADAKKFEAYLDKLVKTLGDGSDLAFLLEEDNSPTRERLRSEIMNRFPKAKWTVYEPLGSELADAAAKAAFGPGVTPVPVFEKAEVILALDVDFLGADQYPLNAVRAFSERRRVEKAGDKMNRLYVVENRYTVTGGMADHRLRIPASQVGAFAVALAAELGIATDAIAQPAKVDFPANWIKELATDLKAARGRSLVLAGNRQPVAVQQLVAAINHALGALGQTLVGMPKLTAPSLNLSELAEAIKAKQITALFILGGNPVYNAPADLDWAALQKSVPEVVRLGLHVDETSQFARWHVPAAHYLESWGDGVAADYSYVSVQPMILPLYGGWSALDLLAKVAGHAKPEGPELIQETYRALASKPGDFKVAWNKFLHDGFLQASTAPVSLAFTGALPKELPSPAGPNSIEVVFPVDSKMDDGRYNNNGWMQELPDPITKTTWDNIAWISPKTARELDIEQILNRGHEQPVIEITVNGRKIEAPAFIVPGHADHSVSLSLGWGRKVVGRVGIGTGVSAYKLRTVDAPYFAVGARLVKLARTSLVAHTQEHFNMEGRGIVREASLEEFNADPGFVKKMGGDEEVPPGKPSLYEHPKLDAPNQWGMAVDLNTCTGCSACVIACQAENNIPIVGKEQVSHGRFMHWIRSDRYFASSGHLEEDLGQYPADPEMVMQPMMCQHCENAPCETVCPVNATVHSPDGLNVMAYNRCIGTRYCANNCPFKVRRFNFFDYHQRPITPVKVPLLGEVSGLKLGPLTKKGSPETLKMQKNPNVTVRMRGVMEKCTFCVQRIQEARIATKVKAGASDQVRIAPDTFMSACQQVCPTGAIVFGDVTNPESRVSKLKEQEKNYRLLEYLNVSPRVSYLGRLRNPNPKMPDAKPITVEAAS